MAQVEHVVVLMLENRSFDHMLGFLAHPDPAFDGLRHGGPYTNPGWEGGPPVAATADARPVIPVDPDHSHDAAVEQFAEGNQGFVTSFERKARGLAQPSFGGLLGPVINFFFRLFSRPTEKRGMGPIVMRCQDPANVPVLATLATEFAVCTRWFCSVPGETWPNRNYLHAATSDGETSIHPRFYTNKTIFELLEEAGHDWRIYHDDVPQAWAFSNLWNSAERIARWRDISELAADAAAGDLPAYTFVEPNHRPPVRLNDRPSNSQHPGNNVADDWKPGDDTDFARAEGLIAGIYEALRGNPELFATTVFVVTYDEHGGLYDHVAPPTGLRDPGTAPSPLGRILRFLAYKNSSAFDFSSTGGRVPAVVVSPLIPPGTLCTATMEHASVPATLRALFAPDAPPLTARDAGAARFDTLCTLPAPRSAVPDLSGFVRHALTMEAAAEPPAERLPDHAQELAVLARRVKARLERRPAVFPGVSWQARDRRSFGPALDSFREAAERARVSR
ncbi:alkaline phosphatase family protein [Nonomuraea soli]|uniref:Phospholipase C n=1 Tax=Nonomuraea soli TaxID=1032476 RepID=A0A7W0CKW5_9ACTN|nr:alkaline phosphatase family protein [Nonomuraea soli]MBA2892820.1 phospholipase C [Nonomuraea soli]